MKAPLEPRPAPRVRAAAVRTVQDAGVAAPPLQRRENQTGLPDEVKAGMEARFGADFSSVRIHAGSAKAVEVGALAYTQGDNVHLAPGQFQPHTAQGKRLLGHELTHVLQQRQGRVAPTGEVGGLPLNDDPALEKEADLMQGKFVAQGQLEEEEEKPLQGAFESKAPATTKTIG